MPGRLAILGLLIGALAVDAGAADPSRRFVYAGADGKLVYDRDARGDRIPDFSHAGYRGGDAPIPNVPAAVSVAPPKGDATRILQAAIDAVSARPVDANGFRGAVCLKPGRYEVDGQLKLAAGGVVLRGSGPDRTILVASGRDRRTPIVVRGRADRQLGPPIPIADEYVPAGTMTIAAKGHAFKVGDTIRIEHPSTKEWIAALGMDRFPSKDKGSWQDWKPGTLDLIWDRIVTGVEGEAIILDAPLTMALDSKVSRARVRSVSWPGRIEIVGIEYLAIESTFDTANPLDEEHAWGGVGFENCRDAWVRNVRFRHLAGSAVHVSETASRISAVDCASERPVSELGGYRRHTYFTAGQQALFLRCRASDGRHDFAVGHLATGPTAFVQCEALNARRFSGGIESWATGILFDNVTMDGGGLALTNREIDAHGAGWAAANSVLYQCTAPVITVRQPPTARNWAIGCWGQFVGDGHWRQFNEFVKPESLFVAQLTERIGEKADAVLRPRAISETPPIADFVLQDAPARITTTVPIRLANGELTLGGRPIVGSRVGLDWWRGHVLPARAAEMGHGLTRFVPGRIGPGLTDDLEDLATNLKSRGHVAVEHHWGLWYDRRRDDHQMIRRIDGEVWPPFYELPWARSGRGRAWDGLSQYDLTKFNPWYFARLARFADLAAERGLVLVQQMYFQHNVLEAGAHWADFPWRPANCLQATGFPEPPPYENKKRIFMAEAFYDVSHPVRRELHRAYIRHCLDVLGAKSNVIFQLGEEYTGPRAFAEFWLDTVAEWEREQGRDVLVSLSCPKDVQDAILVDPVRSKIVEIIDFKYWWYTANGGVYDPPGGRNRAPRQEFREWAGSKSRSPESLAKQVAEYRAKHPDKAITLSFDGEKRWIPGKP